MNEERTGKCLHQVEHIRCHLRHRYSRMVNKVMVETVKFSKWWFQRNPLSRKSWEEPQALEYHINWDIYSISSCVLCLVSYAPNVASVSALFIHDCPFAFLWGYIFHIYLWSCCSDRYHFYYIPFFWCET
jgi:hypothetical protein